MNPVLRNTVRITLWCVVLLYVAQFITNVSFSLYEAHVLLRHEPARISTQTGQPFENGRHIIACLERYKVDYGEYPQKLDLLVPACMEKIPSPSWYWGVDQWQYLLSKDASNFSLCVSSKNYLTEYIYDSDHQTWRYVEY